MREFLSVHDAHCCPIHGCKYCDDDCPVVAGKESGIYCEDCDADAIYQDAIRIELNDLKKLNTRYRGIIHQLLDGSADLKEVAKFVKQSEHVQIGDLRTRDEYASMYEWLRKHQPVHKDVICMVEVPRGPVEPDFERVTGKKLDAAIKKAMKGK